MGVYYATLYQIKLAKKIILKVAITFQTMSIGSKLLAFATFQWSIFEHLSLRCRIAWLSEERQTQPDETFINYTRSRST